MRMFLQEQNTQAKSRFLFYFFFTRKRTTICTHFPCGNKMHKLCNVLSPSFTWACELKKAAGFIALRLLMQWLWTSPEEILKKPHGGLLKLNFLLLWQEVLCCQRWTSSVDFIFQLLVTRMMNIGYCLFPSDTIFKAWSAHTCLSIRV